MSATNGSGFRHGCGSNHWLRPCRVLVLVAVAAALLGSKTHLWAQSFRKGGTEFEARRSVSIPSADLKPIMVSEFFSHGLIGADRKNVLVVAKNQQVVPARVLQLGPGDFCRLAFETTSGQSSYEIFYGGDPPEAGAAPPWTNRDGLLLETRKYKDCNLNQLASVRKAFESAEPIGADYVANVHHGSNPFSLKAAPFLSHYSGQLHINSAGLYGFLTSSQDCSFLLIDGKEVVSAPGRHGPMRRAKRGTRKDIRLSAGAHKFDYYHAASGPAAMMVAAWETSPSDPKPKPTAIPSETFRAGSVGRVEAGTVHLREMKMAPDFLIKIAGSVPLPDNDRPLVGVVFKDMSPKGLTMGGKARWDFGDGQTSTENNPAHVYLQPGVYKVTLSTGRRTARPIEMVNRIYVDAPKLSARDAKSFHKLDDYLPTLQTYDPKTLDSASSAQLVEAYLWKADNLLTPEAPKEAAEPAPEETAKSELTEEETAALKEEWKGWIAKAVAVGKGALASGSTATGDAALLRLARLTGPLARDLMGNSEEAFQIWLAASRKIEASEMKAQCEIEAAAIALNDLLKPEMAKPLLEAASKRLPESGRGPVASRLNFIWADYSATTGEAVAARKRYLKAEEVLGSTKSHLERTAWRGAHSRSTEEFLKEGELERAAEQIHQWEKEFPADKLDGYMSLLCARYWAAREMDAQAIALCEQLLNVSPDAPYADQLLLVAAKCELNRGKLDRAVATLKSLLTNYPGSPLVPAVRENIRQIEAGELPKPKRPLRKRN